VPERQAELARTACLIKADVAEYLAVLPSRDARVIASALEVETLCAGFTAGQKIGSASGCLLSHMQLRLELGDTMEACVHFLLPQLAQSSVDGFALGLWPG
jgi:hypothetical protein